jgi:ribose transport system permease protein
MTRAHKLDIVGRYGVVLPFIIVVVVCAAFVPHFLTQGNISNMLINASTLAVIGVGMTIVIALRGLDLSVGSVEGLSVCVAALVTLAHGAVWGAISGLVVGLMVGLINGVLVAVLRVPAFVATLGTKGVLLGVALIVMHGQVVLVPDKTLAAFAAAAIGPVPVPFVFAVVVIILGYVLVDLTPFGRHLIAVGGNPEAASDSGIHVRRVTLVAYIIAGALASVGGLMLLSQIGTASGTLGQGIELQVIAIAVLGGSSLTGGTANLVGTGIAALLLSFVYAALNLINVPSYFQYLAVGLILLFALGTDSLRRHFQRAALIGE